MIETKKVSGYNKELYTDTACKDRFKRIAERRTNRVIDSLRLLGNTGNKNLYRYSDDEIQRIFTAIDKKITEIKGKFKTSDSEEKFRL